MRVPSKGMRGRSAVCAYCNEEVWFARTNGAYVDKRTGKEVDTYMWQHVTKDQNGQVYYQWPCNRRDNEVTFADPELAQERLV